MEGVFEESELDWTMVRPPELTDKPYTGKYRAREGHLPRFGFTIARADPADFMVKAVENHVSSRKVRGVQLSAVASETKHPWISTLAFLCTPHILS